MALRDVLISITMPTLKNTGWERGIPAQDRWPVEIKNERSEIR